MRAHIAPVNRLALHRQQQEGCSRSCARGKAAEHRAVRLGRLAGRLWYDLRGKQVDSGSDAEGEPADEEQGSAVARSRLRREAKGRNGAQRETEGERLGGKDKW
jgi:hypothetical protein